MGADAEFAIEPTPILSASDLAAEDIKISQPCFTNVGTAVGACESDLTAFGDGQTTCSSHDDGGFLDREQFGCVFRNLKGEWTEQHLDQLFEAADSEKKGWIRLEDSFRVLGEWSKA